MKNDQHTALLTVWARRGLAESKEMSILQARDLVACIHRVSRGNRGRSSKVHMGKWQIPRDLYNMRSFVGLCLYCHQHTPSFTELAFGLKDLATKGSEFMWTS